MSYTERVELADCGAVNPITGTVCTDPPHDEKIPHAGNGGLWGGTYPRPLPIVTGRPIVEITSADPRVVEAFAFGLFSTGAKLNGVTMERATNLWRGSTVEDRAMWLDRARGVVDAAVTYEPA